MPDFLKHTDPGLQLDQREYADEDIHTLGENQERGDLVVAKGAGELGRLPKVSPGKMLTTGVNEPDYAQRQLTQHVHLADFQELRLGGAAPVRMWWDPTADGGYGELMHEGLPFINADEVPTATEDAASVAWEVHTDETLTLPNRFALVSGVRYYSPLFDTGIEIGDSDEAISLVLHPTDHAFQTDIRNLQIFVAGTDIYLWDDGNKILWIREKTGTDWTYTALTPPADISGTPFVYAMAMDDTHIYMVVNDRKIYRKPITGGTFTEWRDHSSAMISGPSAVAVSDSYVWIASRWTFPSNSNGRRIWKIDKSDSSTFTIAVLSYNYEVGRGTFVADDDYCYYTAASGIFRNAENLTRPTGSRSAGNSTDSGALAVDDDYLWHFDRDGFLYRWSKSTQMWSEVKDWGSELPPNATINAMAIDAGTAYVSSYATESVLQFALDGTGSLTESVIEPPAPTTASSIPHTYILPPIGFNAIRQLGAGTLPDRFATLDEGVYDGDLYQVLLDTQKPYRTVSHDVNAYLGRTADNRLVMGLSTHVPYATLSAEQIIYTFTVTAYRMLGPRGPRGIRGTRGPAGVAGTVLDEGNNDYIGDRVLDISSKRSHHILVTGKNLIVIEQRSDSDGPQRMHIFNKNTGETFKTVGFDIQTVRPTPTEAESFTFTGADTQSLINGFAYHEGTDTVYLYCFEVQNYLEGNTNHRYNTTSVYRVVGFIGNAQPIIEHVDTQFGDFTHLNNNALALYGNRLLFIFKSASAALTYKYADLPMDGSIPTFESVTVGSVGAFEAHALRMFGKHDFIATGATLPAETDPKIIMVKGYDDTPENTLISVTDMGIYDQNGELFDPIFTDDFAVIGNYAVLGDESSLDGGGQNPYDFVTFDTRDATLAYFNVPSTVANETHVYVASEGDVGSPYVYLSGTSGFNLVRFNVNDHEIAIRPLPPGTSGMNEMVVGAGFIYGVQWTDPTKLIQIPVQGDWDVMNGHTTMPQPWRDLTYDSTNDSPVGIAGRGDEFYVVDSTDRAAHRYSQSGSYVDTQALGTVTTGTFKGAAISGNVLYAIHGSTIKTFVMSDTALTDGDTLALTTDNADPAGVATDGNHLFVVDATELKIFVYEPDGTPVEAMDFDLDDGNTDPVGVTWDDWRLQVADNTADKVFAYTRSGSHYPHRDYPVITSAEIEGIGYANGYTFLLVSTGGKALAYASIAVETK